MNRARGARAAPMATVAAGGSILAAAGLACAGGGARGSPAPLLAEPVGLARLAEPRPASACPRHMVSIEGHFCIDAYEASLVELTEGHREVAFSPYATLEGRPVKAVSRPNVVPQGYISGVEAALACAQAGKRLCKPLEWRAACEGPRNATYGYGNARERGRCNDAGRSPMKIVWHVDSTSPKEAWLPSKMNDPRLNQVPGSVARTGAHPRCTNGYGVYDMVGNLHEWVDDPDGTFQGGYYLDTSINGEGCAYRTCAHGATYHDYSTGFRCCADPRTEGPAVGDEQDLP